MKKISIKTRHDDYYRSFDLFDYGDDLPEGIASDTLTHM